MSLAETQTLLARLYTDEILRERFLLEPVQVGRECGLNETEIEQIKQIPPAQLNFFAESLTHKRFHEVEKLLPLTRKALGADFRKYFDDFSREFIPKTIKKHLEDAVAFAGFLQKQEFKIELLSDLIKFEQARLEFNAYAKTFVLRRFRFDIREIFSAISRNDASAQSFSQYKKRQTIAVWIRFGNNGKVRHFIF